MKPQPDSKKPAFDVFVVEGERESAFWTKIGAAWPTRDGKGYAIRLAALPLDGRLILREPKSEDVRD
jgi:hypothetical protein